MNLRSFLATAILNGTLLIVSSSAVHGFSASPVSKANSGGVVKKGPSGIQVFDNVLDNEVCSALHQEAGRLGLGHRVFSRPTKNPDNPKSLVEHTLDSILQELGDESEYVEYWTRQEWRSIHAHADVDEYLAKRHGSNHEFRYPDKAHVLYLQIGDKVKGPTCVFPGRRSGGDLLRSTADLVTVPAVPGRLLRFNGDFLHAVPRPTDLWLLNFVQGSPDFHPEEDWGRSVILFNTWGSEPPLEVPIDETTDETNNSEIAASCHKMGDWKRKDLEQVGTDNVEETVNAKIWLLGDLRRRDHQMQTVKLSAPSSIREALEEESKVGLLTLHSMN